MDKRVILAVAGSGKTYHLIEKLDETKRFLLITYTTNNTANLRKAVIEKFGYVPNNIHIQSYFNFLYSFCFKPFLASELNIRGIYWNQPNENTRFLKHSDDKFYILSEKWLYHNRIAKLIIEKNIVKEVNNRLSKYYDFLFVDEVQDFGGHDFNFLGGLSKSNLNILMVGDFFQHTFSTSNDGGINKNLYLNFSEYLKKIRSLKLTVDNTTLINSRRCSKTTCDFIRTQLGIDFFSNNNNQTELKLICDANEADTIYQDSKVVKLFYSESYLYDCYSDNWGSCKGLEFDDVCVVISDEILNHYNNNTLKDLKPLVKNKFYVACSRAIRNLFFVPASYFSKHKKVKAKKARTSKKMSSPNVATKQKKSSR